MGAAAVPNDRQPEYVLLHGTTQSAEGYQRLTRALSRRGKEAVAVQLPADQPQWVAEDYAEFVAGRLEHVNRPVVVGHSGAGLLLPALARRLDARRVVWLAAYVPTQGASLLDELRTDPERLFNPEWLTADPTEDPAAAAYFLFHDCDSETLTWALRTVQRFDPRAAYSGVFTDDGRQRAPSTYVVCRQDRTLRPDWQHMAAATRLDGAEVIELHCGHAPHVSQPEELADLLARQ